MGKIHVDLLKGWCVSASGSKTPEINARIQKIKGEYL